MTHIRISDFTKGRPTTPEIDANILNTINKVEAFLQDFKGEVIVNSGLRDPQSNKAAGGAPNSTHLTGEAIDIADKDGKVMEYVLANLDLAKQIGLWFEDFRWTPTWTHMQTKPPKSLKRIYIPNTNPALAPTRWDSKYDKKFD